MDTTAASYYIQKYHQHSPGQSSQSYYTTSMYQNDLMTANQLIVAAAQAAAYRYHGSGGQAMSHQLPDYNYYNLLNNSHANTSCSTTTSPYENFNRLYNVQPITPPLPMPQLPITRTPLPQSKSYIAKTMKTQNDLIMDENSPNSCTFINKNFTSVQLRDWCIASHPKLASTLLTTSPSNININNNKNSTF